MRQRMGRIPALFDRLFPPLFESAVLLTVLYGITSWYGTAFGTGVFILTLVTCLSWVTVGGERRTARAMALSSANRHGLRKQFVNSVSENTWDRYASPHALLLTLTVSSVLGWILVAVQYTIV